LEWPPTLAPDREWPIRRQASKISSPFVMGHFRSGASRWATHINACSAVITCSHMPKWLLFEREREREKEEKRGVGGIREKKWAA
jgi:hypothetical protein